MSAMTDRSHRWTSFPLVVLIRAYQLLVSPLLPPSCRFYPSCSAYGLTAVQRFGPLRGTWLAVRRLLRCHPWNPGGVDHVPRRGPHGRPVRDNEGHSPCETSAGQAAPAGSVPAGEGAPTDR